MTAIVSAERIRRNGDAGIAADNPADRERVLRIADSCRQANSEGRVRPVLEAFGVPELSPTVE
jgi:guanylate kinase